jgi:hypothetical protein
VSRPSEQRVNLARIALGTVPVWHKMISMDYRERPSDTLRQHASTYVDELIRIAPPCGRPLTAEMREDTIALVEWAMHDRVAWSRATTLSDQR